MITLKSQHALLIFAVMAVLSAIYALAAYVLLDPQRNNVIFTSKEIQGLSDYERIVALYFAPTEAPHTSKTYNDLRKSLRAVGDDSNLILDPEIPSYYAAALLVNDVPLFAGHIVERRNTDPYFQNDLLYHLDGLRYSIQAICRQNNDGCSTLIEAAKRLERKLLASDAVIKRADLMADVEIVTRTTSSLLRSFLHKRLQEQLWQRNLILAFIVCLYFFLVFLMAFALKNYASKREILLARETRKLTVQLEQKNDDLERFAYTAAHDLKEPVRTMCCYAMLLKSEAAGELREAFLDYTGIIEGAARRAEQMINDLLGCTQVCEETLVSEDCDSAKEVEAVLEDLKNLIDKVKPEIVCSDLPVLYTVPSMLRRLFCNLIDNAIKYRKAGTRLLIRLGAKRQDAFWIFSVCDNGIGIAREHRELVFEPFRRLPPALGCEGTGLGLASCKKIIEQLGGAIWIASSDETGTTVCFSLPA